jgi:polar amino acid transport system substrate-binding protein
VTGIQFLIRKADENKFNFNASLQGLTIGSLGDTTAENLIEERYPLANLEQFQGLTGRTRGVQALRQNRIDAFASDGILLRAEAALQSLSLEDYSLVPEQPLTCDRYGMLMPQNDAQWQSLVNSVIESKEAKQIWQKWFERIFSYTEVDEDLCQK